MKQFSFFKAVCTFLLAGMSIFSAQAQYTLIPDVNFEQVLIGQGIDNDGVNGKVLTSRIAGVTVLGLSNSGVVDLTGIDGFTSLTRLLCDGTPLTNITLTNPLLSILTCSSNSLLTTLDISKCPSLQYVLCTDNPLLTSLDVSQNLGLLQLQCYRNKLTSLDVSKNTALKVLTCQENPLSSLDVSTNTLLTTLNVDRNLLTNLDVSKNINLTYLSCQNNQLGSLDVSTNIALTDLYCSNSSLTSLDVTKNTALAYLFCSNNQLTSLNVSKNISLFQFYCDNNKLSRLDLTKNVNCKYLTCKGNSNLEICVIDVTAAYNRITYVKDLDQTYVNYCVEPIITGQNNAGQSICSNNSFSSIFVSVTGRNLTYQWYKSATPTNAGGISLGSAAQTNVYVPLSTQIGTNYYYCVVSNSFVDVTSNVFGPFVVSAVPTIPAIASPLNYCIGNPPQQLVATGTNVKWYTLPNSGTSIVAPTVNTSSSGIVNYYFSQTIGGCESDRAAIIVQVNPKPAAPLVSATVSYCVGATATQLSASGTNLKWYATQTATAFSTTAATPTTIATGTTNYYVSQTSNGCESDRSVIAVTAYAIPAAPSVTSPVNYCQGAVASPLTATGNNLTWYTSTGTALTAPPVPATTATGATSYLVSQTVNGCESSKSTIIVQVNAPAALPTVTANINYCVGAAATPLTASGTNLKWYTTPNGGAANTLAPTPVTTASGTFAYYVSQTVGTCESDRAAIIVQVNPKPAAPLVSSAVSYCIGATATPLTASGTNVKWYATQTATTFSTTATTPTTIATGTTNYYVSQTSNGCESDRSVIAVTVYTIPAAPSVTSPVNYCQGAATSSLTATGSNLIWYTSTGTALTSAPAPSTAATGSTSYLVSQTVNGCESSKSTITIQVNTPAALPIVTANISYCVGATATSLTASGTNLKWYTTPNGGTAATVAPTPATTASGNFAYYVSQTVGTCESDRAAIIVNVNTGLTAPQVAASLSYCAGAIAVPLTATGTNLKWYATQTATAFSTTATTPTTIATGTTNYYVSQTSNGCESDRSAITVTVYAVPTAPSVTTPVNYCQGASAASLNATGSNLIWYTSTGTALTGAPIPATSATGSTSYSVSQTINGCESNKSTIAVQVSAPAALPVVATNIKYCVGATAVPLTATGTNLKWYTSANTGTAATVAPTPVTTVSGNFVYYVSQTVGTCESGRAAMLVQVNPKPAVPVVSSQVNYCVGSGASPLIASGSDLKWYATQTTTSFSSVTPIPATGIAATTSYYVSQTYNSCESDRSAITVTVNALPSSPAVASPVNYCQGAVPTSLIVWGSDLIWYASDGTVLSATTPPVPSTSVSGSTSYFVSQTANGCESRKNVVVVNVNTPLPSPVVTSNITYCVGAAAVPLNATGLNLKWYTLAMGGIGDIAVPIPSTTVTGIKEYYVSQSLNDCESSRSKITVTVTAAPSAPAAVSPVEYCVGSSASALTATGANLSWSLPGNACSSSTTATVPSTSNVGTTSYFVSQISGGCESAKKEIIVVVSDRPQLPVVISPVNVSIGAAASALTATGSNLKWYTAATGGVDLGAAPTPTTTAIGNIDYYISQTINGCESERALIRVTVSGDISGPACSSIGGTSSYQVHPSLATNAVYYNWWVNGLMQITSHTTTQATVSIGQYYTTGEICVGINYDQVPWYKEVCRKVDLCSPPLSLTPARQGSIISVFPNPSTAAFTINASEDISNVTIYNALGQKVSVVGTVLAGQDVAFGSELPAGMYVVQYQIQNLKYTKSIIKQ